MKNRTQTEILQHCRGRVLNNVFDEVIVTNESKSTISVTLEFDGYANVCFRSMGTGNGIKVVLNPDLEEFEISENQSMEVVSGLDSQFSNFREETLQHIFLREKYSGQQEIYLLFGDHLIYIYHYEDDVFFEELCSL